MSFMEWLRKRFGGEHYLTHADVQRHTQRRQAMQAERQAGPKILHPGPVPRAGIHDGQLRPYDVGRVFPMAPSGIMLTVPDIAVSDGLVYGGVPLAVIASSSAGRAWLRGQGLPDEAA